MLKTTTSILSFALVSLVLVACGGSSEPETAAQNYDAQASPDEAAQPELVDGVQVVHIEAGVR